MSDNTAIQAYEAKKGNGPFGLFGSVSVLIVRILPFDPFPLESEMRHVNYHFMNWLSRHGAKCGELVLEFFAPISLRPAIEEQITRLLIQDCHYNEIICRMKTEFTIQDPHTGETIILGARRDSETASPPPIPPSSNLRDDDDRYKPPAEWKNN